MTPMGSHHPFGPTGGPGCIHDYPGIVTTHHDIRLITRGSRQQILIPNISIRDRPISQIDIAIPGNREPVFDALNQLHEGHLHYECLTFRMVEDVLYTRTCRSEHDGNNDLPAVGTAGVNVHPLATIIGDRGKGVLVSHAQVSQTICQTAGALVPFSKGKFLALILPSQLIGIIDGIHLQDGPNMHAYSHFSSPLDATLKRAAPTAPVNQGNSGTRISPPVISLTISTRYGL